MLRLHRQRALCNHSATGSHAIMNEKIYKLSLIALAISFTTIFCVVVVPPFLKNPDVLGAFAGGFVNPYATGYSTDVLFCWAAFAIFVVYEAKTISVKYGWLCLILGIVPGVAVGLAVYLLIRQKQLKRLKNIV